MKQLAALVSLAAIACTTVPDGPAVRCNADRLGGLAGREASSALGAEALRRSGARTLRWIRPGDAVTMDYREDRLNIHVDARGRVERFACG